MKTPQQIRKEVEKGCGVTFGDCYYEDMNPRECGKDKIHYCEDCRAQLSILTEYDKSIKEMIENKINKLEEARYKLRKLSYVSKEDENIDDTLYHQICVLKDIKYELLSKIGDNSEIKRK